VPKQEAVQKEHCISKVSRIQKATGKESEFPVGARPIERGRREEAHLKNDDGCKDRKRTCKLVNRKRKASGAQPKRRGRGSVDIGEAP